MKIVRHVNEMSNLCTTFRSGGETIGLVPTMGALHEGHLSLLDHARQCCSTSVMSIFVNPVQFGPREDFARYPRPFEADCEKARQRGCDVLFAPTIEEMYPDHYHTYVQVEGITDRLCGALRPGHFRGVTTVVYKFFNILSPHCAFFGQKDAQQVVVLKRMVKDLNCPVRIVVAPTVREHDGLAMSSRNVYLSPDERRQAATIYRGLTEAARLYDTGERAAQRMKEAVAGFFEKATLLSPDYVEVVDTVTLEPLHVLSGPALVAVAVKTKETQTRLIDNIILGGNL